MKIKPTFFNTRNERLHWNYKDSNNWLFKIIYKDGFTCKEQNYILRDLKQDKKIVSYIYKKIKEQFDVIEIFVDKLSKYEYDLAKSIQTPSIINCVKTKRIFKK